MKKLISLLLLTLSTHAAAEVINCPTIKEHTFREIPWTLLASKNNSDYISPNNYEQDFYNYDPGQNMLEGNTATIYGPRFEYNPFSSRAAKDEKSGITLQCSGLFSSNECPTSWLANCTHIKRYLRASLPLGNEYKSCIPITGTSFDCETTRELING